MIDNNELTSRHKNKNNRMNTSGITYIQVIENIHKKLMTAVQDKADIQTASNF